MAKSKEADKAYFVPDEREKRLMRLFKRVTAVPYLLVFLALLMPFVTVSCTGANLTPTNNANQDSTVQAVPQVEMKETVLLDVNLYQIIAGINVDEQLTPEGKEVLKGKDALLTKMLPDYPKAPGLIPFAVVLLGVLLAAVFAQFTPLGSIAISMLTWVAMWFGVSFVGQFVGQFPIPVIKVEPGVGIYAATFMIFFGVAMNFASIIRPIIMEVKARRQAKKKAKA